MQKNLLHFNFLLLIVLLLAPFGLRAQFNGMVAPSQTICEGSSPAPLNLFSHFGAVVGWQRSTSPTFAPPVTDFPIPSSTLVISPTPPVGLYYYRAVIDTGGGPLTFSMFGTLTVEPRGTPGALTGSVTTVSSVSDIVTLSLRGFTARIMRWEYSDDNFATMGISIVSTDSTITQTGIPAGVRRCFRAVVQNAICPEIFSNFVCVENTGGVLPTLGGALTGPDRICISTTPSISLIIGGQRGTILSWQHQLPGAPAFVDIPGTAGLTSYVATPVAGITRYRVRVQNPGSFETTSTVWEVTAFSIPSPLPTPTATPPSVTSPTASSNVVLSGGFGSLITRWEYSDDGGATHTPIASRDSSIIVTGIPNGVNRCVRAVITNGPCTFQSAPVCIRNTGSGVDSTLGGTVFSDQTICIGDDPAALDLLGERGDILGWQQKAPGASVYTDIPGTAGISSLLPASLSPGVSCFRARVQNTGSFVRFSNPACVTVGTPAVPGTLTVSGSTTVTGVPNTTIINMTGGTGRVVRWETSMDGGRTWLPIANTSIRYVLINITMNTCVRVVVRDTLCGGDSASTPVCITFRLPSTECSRPPYSLRTSNDTTICRGTSLALFARADTGSFRYEWSPAAGLSSPTVPNPVVATLTSQTYVVTATHLGTGCRMRDTVNITVDSAATGGVLTDQSICAGSPATLLTQFGHSGSIVRWESSVNCTGPYVGIPNTLPTFNPGVPTITTCYRAVIATGCGTFPSRPARITVSTPLTTTPRITPTTLNLCFGAMSMPSTVVSPRPGSTYRWYDAPTGGRVVHTGTSFSPPTTTLGYQYYYLAEEVGGCASRERAILVVLTSRGTAPTPGTSTYTFCRGSVGVIRATSSATFARFEWFRTATGGTAIGTGPSLTVPTTIARTDSYYVQTVDTFGCVSSRALVRVVVSTPPMPMANTPATVCPGTRTNLVATGPTSGGLFFWYDSPTATTPLNPTGLAVRAAFLSPPVFTGRNCFYLEHISAGCTSARRTVCVPISPSAPAAPTGTAVPTLVCVGSPVVLRASGPSSPSTLRFTWRNAAGAVIGSSLPFPASITVVPTTIGVVNYTLEVSNGICASDRRTVSVRVEGTPIGGTLTGGGTFCVGSTASLLLGGFRGTIVRWETSGDGFTTITPIAATSPALTIPVSSGTKSVRAVIRSCGRDVFSTVATVTGSGSGGAVGGRTIVATGSGIICADSIGSVGLRLTGHSGRITQWERSRDSLFTSPVIIRDTLPGISQTLGFGVYYFRARVEGGAGCPAVYSTPVRVEVRPAPNPGVVGPDQTFCTSGSVATLVLTGQTPGGTVVRWEQSFDGRSFTPISHTVPTYIVTGITRTVWYRAVLFYPTCGTYLSRPAKLTVTTGAIAGRIEKRLSPGCGPVTGELVATGFTGAIVRWERLDGGLFSSITPIPIRDSILRITASGPTGYRYVVEIPGCGVVTSDTVFIIPRTCPPATCPAVTFAIVDSSSSVGFARVSWVEPTPRPSGYEVSYSLDGGASFITMPTVPAGTNFAWITGLTPGTTILIRVASLCGTTRSPFFTLVHIVPLPSSCPAPRSIEVDSVREESLRVRWAGVSGAIRYEVSFRPVGSTTWVTIVVPGTLTGGMLTGLMPDTNYEIRVRTICASGTSGYISTTARTLSSFCPAPTIVFATAETPTSVRVNWPGIGSPIGYEVSYRALPTGSWVSLPISTALGVVITGLTPGTIYEARVRAICRFSISTTVSDTALTPDGSCMAPTDVIARPSRSFATLSWTPVLSAVRYDVRYRLSTGTTWITVSTTSPIVTLSGLTPGATYVYEVRTICSSGLVSPPSLGGRFITLGGGPCVDIPVVNTRVSPSSCNGSDGAIAFSIAPTAGFVSGRYRILRNGTELRSWSALTTSSFTVGSLTSGIYTMELIADGDTCVTRQTIALNAAGFTLAAVDISPASVSASCRNGALTVLLSGSFPPSVWYQYSMDNGRTWSSPSTSSRLTGLLGGASYWLRTMHATVTDSCYTYSFVSYNVPCTSPREGVAAATAADMSMALYPNPTRGAVQVALTNAIAGEAQWSLVDVTGRVIHTQSITTNTGEQQLSLDFGDVRPGVYFFRFQQGADTKATKLVIE